MIREANFLTFWRTADSALIARRHPGLPLGRAHLYWLVGFTAAQAADAEVFKGRI